MDGEAKVSKDKHRTYISLPNQRYKQVLAFAKHHKLTISQAMDNALRIMFAMADGREVKLISFCDDKIEGE